MKDNFSPTVFIGMPVFNSETSIRKTLNSILNQDYTEWKLLISDNFSSDMTLKICEEFAEKDQRITLYQQPKNIGAWYNFLYVLENSVGTYFKFQAGDDILSKDFISSNVRELEADDSILGSSSPECWDWEYIEKLNCVNFELMGSQRSRFRTLKRNCWRSNSLFYAIYRKTELRKVITEDIFGSTTAIQDWLILARLAALGNIKRSSSGLMVLGSNGSSNSNDLRWFTQLSGFRAKIFPYSDFYSLIKQGPNKLSFGSILEIFFWVVSLQLNHFKGLLWLALKGYGWRKRVFLD